MVDYKDLLLRYAQAVVDDDYVVGLRRLEDLEGSEEELRALMEIHRHVWPDALLGPWTEDKFTSTNS